MNRRKKLIEVALPLEAINQASAREKSIRHGHPSTLHLWWSRKPTATARVVIFAQMVDDPASVPEEFPTPEAQERERRRLFRLIEQLVQWENTTNETVLQAARDEIWKSWRRTCRDHASHPRAAELFNPDKLPAFHDPFAGGGALPLEAQRLGLQAYASDLNPVAVLINKAMIEIPPRFAGQPPVNPEARREKTLLAREWRGAQGLAEDVRSYGQWMRDEAEKRIGHLYPKIEVTPELAADRADLKPLVGQKLTVIAWLWVRTVKSPNPAFAHVDVPLAPKFWLSSKPGKEAYVEPVITYNAAPTQPSPAEGGMPPPQPSPAGGGMPPPKPSPAEGGSMPPPQPSPAGGGSMPPPQPSPAGGGRHSPPPGGGRLGGGLIPNGGRPGGEPRARGGPGWEYYRFTVKVGKPKDPEAVKNGTSAGKRAAFKCLMSGTPIPYDYIRDEGQAGRMGARLMAIVAEGPNGRVYLPPTLEHERIAREAKPTWKPEVALPANTRDFKTPLYGLTTYGDLFTPRQLEALVTFSDLVGEAMERVKQDYLRAMGEGTLTPALSQRGMDAPTPALSQKGMIAPTPALPRWGREPFSSPQRGEVGRGATTQRQEAERGASQPETDRGANEAQPWQPTPVPPALLQAARDLRKTMTDAEQMLWQCLRGKQLDGFKFRRQHPIDRFVLDFYCPAAQLAVELDGSQHNTEQGRAADAERTAWLNARGIRVLRFWNSEVFSNLEGVITTIWEALHAHDSVGPNPAPDGGPHASPLPEGDDSPHPNPPPTGDLRPHTNPPPLGEGAILLPPAGGGWEGGHYPAGGGWEGGHYPAGGGREGGHYPEGDHTTPLRDGGTGAQAYAEAVGVYLGIGVSRQANRTATLNFWDQKGENIQQVFARQALPMTWDFVEGNPLSGSTGNFVGQLEYLTRVVEETLPASPAGSVKQQDAQNQELTLSKIVSTDPPYYDNIGYADLSDFFYVWLRRSLRSVFPDLFATLSTPKAEELVATPYRHGSREKAEQFFLDGMTQAMHRLAEQAHPAFPVTIYYAFKQSETESAEGTSSTGWETFLDAVIRAGFAISGTWPMRTEYTGNLKKNVNALASSIVLVCRPRTPSLLPSPSGGGVGWGQTTATRRAFVQALKAELPAALAELQKANIAPVDLAQAAIGPGMAVYTRYARVLDAEGRPVSVREALALINATLDEALAEQEGDFDADTRWAIAWFDQYGFAEGEYGVAETLSKAKNTSVEGMVEAGILESRRGRVRLLKPAELPADWDPATDPRLTAWEVVHHLIRALEAGGESGAATLVGKLGAKAETARELAYRLYTLCERKKRAAEALSYNALVQSWPEIVRLARESGTARPAQETLFEDVEA